MPIATRSRMGFAACILLGLVQAYRYTLSFWLGGRCCFAPSCSVYALEALRQHGAWRGMVLIVGRLMRCHPWHEAGVDPVPAVFPGVFVRMKR